MSAPSDARQVLDRRLGMLWFAASDTVIGPAVETAGIWEPSEGLWLDTHVGPGMTVVNVGANVGYFALWAADIVGPHGHVVAVEPYPENVALLRANIADRNLTHVEVCEAAASSGDGQIELFVNDDNAGDHRVFDPAAAATVDPGLERASRGFREAPSRLTVRSVTVDSLVAERRIDVLFVDTQGHDHEVIAGARSVLRRDRPIVLTEFTPAWIRAQGADPAEVLAGYRALGYRVGVWDAGAAPGDWPDHRIVEWASVPGRWFTNLELWPKERALPPRVQPGTGFWTVERSETDDLYWLTSPQGGITLTGPPDTVAQLQFTAVCPPGRRRVRLVVADHHVVIRGSRLIRTQVRLDRAGRAEVALRTRDDAVQVPGDPRDLYVAMRNPTVQS